MKSLFQENLRILKAKDPVLAKRVERETMPENITLSTSKDGNIVPVYNNVSLHSSYYPGKEAENSVAAFCPNADSEMVVFGLGFGYHILELLKKESGDIIVIEPRMSLFRVFMEYQDISVFLPRVSFLVDEPPSRILARKDTTKWELFAHQASTNISSAYYQRLESSIRVMDTLESQSLKILVINPIYGGSLPTSHFCKQALQNMGHEVESVDCEKFRDSFQAIQGVTSIIENQGALNQNFINLMGEVAIAKAVEFRPDLVLVLAQAPMSPNAFERFKKMKAPLAFWFVEDFRTMTYWKESAQNYDYFFTIQRGECFEALEKEGIRNYYYLPQAAAPDVHRPVDLTAGELERFQADVSFMGEGYHNRRASFRRLIDFDLKIWGTGWAHETHYHPYIQNKGKRVETDDCVKIYNAGKINMNLHSSTFHDGVNPNGDFVNPRTFEIAACKSFQLVDERSELAECFEVGKEIITFSNMEELRQKLEYYLSHPDERDVVAQKGYERIMKEHTMEHRMKEMLLHIYSEREEELQIRLKHRKTEIGMALKQSAGDPELTSFLQQFEGQQDFDFRTVMDGISKGDGNLSDQELLFLMVDQIIPKKKTSHV